MPFPIVSYGNVLSLSVWLRRLASLERGLDPRRSACNGSHGVLHDGGVAVLEPEVVLAEPRQALARAFVDVAVAPAVHLGPREPGDVSAVSVADPVPRRHPGQVAPRQ